MTQPPRAIARYDGERVWINAQRKRGLVWIAAGLVIGAAMFAGLIALDPQRWRKAWAVPVVVPLFTTLIGAIKLVTGRTLGELGRAYESMSGLGRFVTGVLVVALALCVIGVLVAIAFAIML